MKSLFRKLLGYIFAIFIFSSKKKILNKLSLGSYVLSIYAHHPDPNLFNKTIRWFVENNFSFLKKWPSKKYDAVFLAVPHKNILARKLSNFLNLLKKQGILLDFKSVLPSHQKILRW